MKNIEIDSKSDYKDKGKSLRIFFISFIKIIKADYLIFNAHKSFSFLQNIFI